MSTTLEIPHRANRALSDMGTASKATARLFTLGALVTPGERLPGAEPGRAKTASVSSTAAEASLLLGLAATLLSLAEDTGHRARRVGLEAFAGLLQSHGMLSESLDYSADEGILQKCAFIAQEGFGLNLGYRYHLHPYGTFSPLLAGEFSRLAKRAPRPARGPMPARFREEEFLELVSGKGMDWLCVASMVVHERASCEPGDLGGRVERVSAAHNRRLVGEAVREIGAALGLARGARA